MSLQKSKIIKKLSWIIKDEKMKKQIIILSIYCGSILSANMYNNSINDINNTYQTSIKKTVNIYNNTKLKYDKYKKEKEQKKQEKLNACILNFKDKLPKYRLFLEQYYMNANKNNEAKILLSYKKLNRIGISQQLDSTINKSTIKKLYSSTSTIEYTNIILSELKKIEEKLQSNNINNLDNLIKQTEFFMFAWTAPMEIFSTKNIYNNSLLDLSDKLYKHLNKQNYNEYSKFIYSMLFMNIINENVIDKENFGKVCKKLLNSYTDKNPNDFLSKNLISILDINKEKINQYIDNTAKKNNLFESAIIFNKNLKNLNKVNIIDNPLNDNWYMMIREYMELQNNFYKMKKNINKIIILLSSLPDSEKEIATLKEDLFQIDSLYRKFDEIVRYNIIDLPISIYADLYYNKLKKVEKWYKKDTNAISNIAVAYNKSCANMQQYMVSEFAINKVMKVTRALKKDFNQDEWKEVITKAKLTQDWFNMLNKIKITNK